jgi:hypothetical protein
MTVNRQSEVDPMGEQNAKGGQTTDSQDNIQSVVRVALQEVLQAERSKAEPAYKAELLEERRRREHLEHRLNELVEENRKSRQLAEELDRASSIRSELQRLGVTKVDLAFKAVKDDIRRAEDGRLIASTGQGEVPAKEYLHQFVTENPELLPARVTGGSGASSPRAAAGFGGSVDIDKIRPGMSAEELERVRQEIARVAQQAMKGL